MILFIVLQVNFLHSKSIIFLSYFNKSTGFKVFRIFKRIRIVTLTWFQWKLIQETTPRTQRYLHVGKECNLPQEL